MFDDRVEKGIDRYISYIRRMNTLNDDQLFAVLSAAMARNPNLGKGMILEDQIKHIRYMAEFTDDQIKKTLLESTKDPEMAEIFEDGEKKKEIKEIEKMAKDIKGDPRMWARKVDKF